jgi:CheY-like chemotaxis protein
VDDGTRTHDNRNHNPGLYQLSYVHHSKQETLLLAIPCPKGIEQLWILRSANYGGKGGINQAVGGLGFEVPGCWGKCPDLTRTGQQDQVSVSSCRSGVKGRLGPFWHAICFGNEQTPVRKVSDTESSIMGTTETNYSVLIVDDEPVFARNLAAYLRRAGYDVKAVADGEGGVESLDTFLPQAVLLDYHLPGMNGLETLGHMRYKGCRAKVIMMSADDNERLVLDAIAAGACDFIFKPCSLGEIGHRVAGVLGIPLSPATAGQGERRNQDGGAVFPLLLSSGVWLLRDRRTPAH